MNDMNVPFTNCPLGELACMPTASNPLGRFSLRSEFARRLNLGCIRRLRPTSETGKLRQSVRGDYRRCYAVCVTVAVTLLCVARLPARRDKDQKRAQQPSAHSLILLPFSFVG